MKTCPPAFLQKRENFSFMKQAFILLNISIQQGINRREVKFSSFFFRELFASLKKVPTFASAIEKQTQIRESKSRNATIGWPVRLSV
ncbi:hypothetical protein, partial [Bacteroides acidifaciens]|uniref:hypothetical protein n=1 Tax=Bacteroides acidifaciens TaxID=85831 RepID=UPI0027154FCF